MRKGFGLLEIVVALAIVGGSLYALASLFLLVSASLEVSSKKLQASFLAEEGFEVLKFLRDSGWNKNIATLASGSEYYLSFSPPTSYWSIIPTSPGLIDGVFTRSFHIDNVSRDGSANIEMTYNPVNDDPETKKVVMQVQWSFKSHNYALVFESYLTDLFNN